MSAPFQPGSWAVCTVTHLSFHTNFRQCLEVFPFGLTQGQQPSSSGSVRPAGVWREEEDGTMLLRSPNPPHSMHHYILPPHPTPPPHPHNHPSQRFRAVMRGWSICSPGLFFHPSYLSVPFDKPPLVTLSPNFCHYTHTFIYTPHKHTRTPP